MNCLFVRWIQRHRFVFLLPVLLLFVCFSALGSAPVLAAAAAQSGANSGTVTGTVTDQTGAAIPGAAITLRNPISGYSRTSATDATGQYQFFNVPFNPYHISIVSKGFADAVEHASVRSSVPVTITTQMKVTSVGATVTVEAPGGDLVENSATFHTDLEREKFDKLPLESKSASLSSLLTLASPGVSADSNGLVHGLGDHAENAFYVDGQPETDQQSKVFSNQLPLAAIESIEVISGAPPAEYGEKTSLVANVTTRSGLGTGKAHGTVGASYGSFGSSTASGNLAVGSARYGNFVAADFLNTGRFLDPGEFQVMHDKGNIENLFDRVDFQPSATNYAHLNFQATRSWFQVPNSYDNLNVIGPGGTSVGNADQRAKIVTFNVASSLSHTISPQAVVTAGLWMRRDAFNYYPSKNAFADLGPIQQESIDQQRSLLNTGGRADYAYVKGANNLKFGGTYQQTFLNENFGLGIVDPHLNAPCVDARGAPVNGFSDPSQCAGAGYFANDAANPAATRPFNPLLGCLDLTRPAPATADRCAASSATPFRFAGHTDVKLLSLYGQDAVTLGHFSLNFGVRGDFYNGLSRDRQAEPRAGLSYDVARTGTVLRVSYARTMETPFNENLILSSHGCDSPVIAALVPCIPANFNPGFRNEFHAGFEQSFGKRLVVNSDYLWKYTHNGYDFSVLGATPITFPIEWHNGKISGFAVRATVPNYHGLSAFAVLSSVAARFFPPQIGGLGATQTGGAPFRIDHDEKFNSATNVQYQMRNHGPYASFTWHYDSGQVAGQVPFATDTTTPVDLTGLTTDQQQQAGLICGSDKATLTNRLTTCAPSLLHSDLLRLPAPGTENADHNPPRVLPRSLFDVSLGEDNLFRTEKHKVSGTLTVVNLTNKYALYNFLSTFSGTHYVTPRAITAELDYHF